ncbi:MAG: hypothetical protein ACK53Y_16310 [bacterium]
MTCNLCEKAFTFVEVSERLNGFIEHSLTVHKHPCPQCDKIFVLPKELIAHKDASHGGGEAGKEGGPEEEEAAEKESDKEAVGGREPAAPAAALPSAENFWCSMCGVEVSL